MSIATLARDPFIGRKPSEDFDKFEIKLDDVIKRNFDKYRGLFIPDKAEVIEMHFQIEDKEFHVMNPSQIDIFLQLVSKNVERERFVSLGTGLVIADLIQKSYNNGHTNFRLSTYDSEISNLCRSIKGIKEKPINVFVDGHTGHEFGECSKYCNFVINGDAGPWCGNFSENSYYKLLGLVSTGLGSHSEHSIFRVFNDVPEYCGSESESSFFHIDGNAGFSLGDKSNDSYFHVKGDVAMFVGDKAWNSKFYIGGLVEESDRCIYEKEQHCFFKSPNPETIKILEKLLPLDNHVELIK